MALGIIGAMDEEIAILQNLMDIDETREIGGMIFYLGRLEGKSIVLVKCGIGKVNAALCAHILINKFSVKKIIFTGVAGAADPGLDIGDVIISSDSMYHDVNVGAFGYQRGQIPRLPVRAFPAAPELIAVAKKAAEEMGTSRVFIGRILTGDQFIANKSEALRLGAELDGICVEMEGAGVGQTCYYYKIPYVLIRCISDKADSTAPNDFRCFCQQAADTAAKIICSILRHSLNGM
ncbi:MAG: 5'-methylthioadenosine/adenosylhomocysteine nucleosidase [bacterium]|jgi:adenosylhomocysteine nucleosidase